MSCTKISRYWQLNAWRMEITTCTGNSIFLKLAGSLGLILPRAEVPRDLDIVRHHCSEYDSVCLVSDLT